MATRFQNLDPAHRRPTRWDVFRWLVIDRLLGRRRAALPGDPAPRVAPDLALIQDPSGPDSLTWIGHASVFGRIDGKSFLIDPNFSRRIGWFYQRHGEPGLTPEQLPRIDLALVTHNHYDHFDVPSLTRIDRSATVVVPQRMGDWFCRQGFARVIELGWWERAAASGLQITCVPARHWSRRSAWDTNRALWSGFVLAGSAHSIYHAGDTAWFEGFEEIARRFPNLDAALIPVGAYEPRWFMEKNHVSPEEAGRAFLTINAACSIPIHWGAFQMADEPLSEGPARLQAWWGQNAVAAQTSLQTMAVGETLLL
jgi:L-ascorbate metabolism protein UlaG (beta-lactamase superfamily)